MSQKLKCPLCAGEVTLEQLVQTADLEALGKAQAAFGDDWDLIREYLDCFRPQSGKALAVKKLLRLAREVWEMWRPGRFEFNRAEFAVGREEFREALRTTCNQVRTGLTNHNYLKKVLLNAAEKTSQRQEREFKEREGRLQSGLRGESERPGPFMPGAVPPPLCTVTDIGEEVRRILPTIHYPKIEDQELLESPEYAEWRAEFQRLLKRGMAPRLSQEERARRQREFREHIEKEPLGGDTPKAGG